MLNYNQITNLYFIVISAASVSKFVLSFSNINNPNCTQSLNKQVDKKIKNKKTPNNQQIAYILLNQK